MKNNVFKLRRFNRLQILKNLGLSMNFWYFLPHRCGIVLDKPKTFLIHFTIHGFVQFTLLKEQSNEIFDPQFFSSFELVWATDQWVKIFSNLVSFLPRYSKFSIEKTDYAQYHTARSQTKISSQNISAKMKIVALFQHNLNSYLFYDTVPLKACAKV